MLISPLFLLIIFWYFEFFTRWNLGFLWVFVLTDSQTENVYYISADITSQPENPGKGKNPMLNQLNLIKPSVLQTGRRPARRQRRVVLWQKDRPMRTICTQTLYIGGSQSGSSKSRESSLFNHATLYGANSLEIWRPIKFSLIWWKYSEVYPHLDDIIAYEASKDCNDDNWDLLLQFITRITRILLEDFSQIQMLKFLQISSKYIWKKAGWNIGFWY